jgi:predicted CXXCH cytochrome family protein
MLTFFFDGVPSGDSIKSEADANRINENDSSKVFRSGPFAENSGYTIHYPYREKECASCHDENNKSELVMAMPALCYTCHDDFSKTYKYVHGPVSTGYCTSCHNPHMSKEKKLLIRTGQQLCLFCHDIKAVMKNQEHKDIADTECTLCHNPHGGENRFILN